MNEPSRAIFHRSTTGNRLASAIMATRPAFLSASLLPVLVGLAAAWHEQGWLHWGVAGLTLLAVGLIHAGANVFNDYWDAQNGSDAVNVERIYPFSGGSRFIQNGIYAEREILYFALHLLIVGTLCGLILVVIGGPLLFLIGAVGVGLAMTYSAPPCLACRGMGDVVIVICFGVLPVAGTISLQTATIPDRAWWLGTAVGLFTAAILWINSIPDINADRLAGKWTLPARLGPERSRYGLPVLFVAGIIVISASPGASENRLALLAVLPVALATWRLFQGSLGNAIPLTLASHAVFCLLLIADYTLF